MADYKARTAQDAAEWGYGTERYWRYLDESAQEKYDYYMAEGDPERANEMMVRTLTEALRGNDGD